MYNDLPDVLMGDIFVEAALMPPDEPESTSDVVMKDEVVIDVKDELQKPVHPKSSSELVSGLPDVARFFALVTPPPSSSVAGSLACDACGLALKRSSTFIRCADCTEPLVDLCPNCFANGAEFGRHSRHHQYVVIQGRACQLTKQSKLVNKLNIHHMLQFMETAEKKGCFNFSDLERLYGDGEKLYLEIVTMLSDCAEQPQSMAPDEEIPDGLSGGPANFNFLRDEFEHEYVPEAETLLAAVPPPPLGELPSEELTTLFEGYNGILDERERRRKTLKAAKLVTLREFYNVLKKRKTDEKEMFEKVRMFTRAVIAATPNESCIAALESFAAALTQRKRLIERAKRLTLLKQHGVHQEAGESVQFDIDRKKRNDLLIRKSTPGAGLVRVWTAIPAVANGGAASDKKGINLSSSASSTSMTAEEALRQLPGGELLKDAASVGLCLELLMAPQHFLVVTSALSAAIKNRGRSVSDEELRNIVQEGVFGTIRRYLLAAQGLPVSAVPSGGAVLSTDEMRQKLVDHCRRFASR
jgi:hypothetical protein